MANSGSPQFCTFYIVRHGETEWNTQKLLQGHSDSPLTENGLQQAKEAAQIFQNVKFAEVFSSDLLRAKRTAEIIAQEHDLLVKATQLLRERNFGKYEGKLVSTFRKELNEMTRNLTEAQKKQFKLADNMESDAEIGARLFTFLRETALAYPNQNVLVVTHSGVIRLLLYELGFVEGHDLDRLAIKNLAHIKLDCDGTEFFLRETHNISKQ